MKKLIAVLLFFTVFATFLTSCKGSESISEPESETVTDSVFPYTFTDSNGNKVTLTQRPKRVAVLFSSYAEIWGIAGGKTDITVGDSIKRGFADSNAVLVDETTGHSEIDLEKLIAEKPDFIIGTTDYESQVKACSFAASQGIPSAVFKVETIDDYINMLKISCDITGNSESFYKNGTLVKEKADELLKETTGIKEKGLKILFVRAGSTAKSTKAKNTEDNFACGMLSEIGTVNIADSDKQLLDGLSIEAILAAQPDYIFVSLMGDETAAKNQMESLLASPGWKDLECVKNGTYVYLPKDMFHYKPNSRWAQAYEYLINLLKD